MSIAFFRKYSSMANCIVMLAAPATAAYAMGGLGDIVYDPTNYVQAVKQVQAWSQQHAQMAQSLAKAEATLQQVKSQVNAMTGNRGLGDLFNNPSLKSIVPTDLSSTLTSLNATGVLSGRAAILRSSSAVYTCNDVTDSAAKTACRVLLGQTAQFQAVQQETMALLNQRTIQIDALRAEINATEDPKAIAELQARLQAEEAQVANDQNKIVLTNAMLATNQAAAAQAEQERVSALMATNKTSVLDGFSFTAHGQRSSTEVAEVDQ